MELLLLLLLGGGLAALLGESSDGDGGEPDPREEPDTGTEGDDTVTLSQQDDFFDGLGGDDEITGDKGWDTLSGGDGNDLIDGGLGTDLLFGNAGDDTLFGGSFDDLLSGGTGNDEAFGGNSDDLIFGGDGEDVLFGEDGDDLILGGNNQEGPTDESDEAFDSLYGGDGDDDLFGGRGEDLLFGGAGNDVLVGSDVLRVNFTEESIQEIIDDPDAELPAFDEEGFQTESGINYDELRGGAGNDLLILGGFDVGDGGSGEDSFVIGDYIAAGTAASIVDFDNTEDIILIGIEDSNASADITTTMSDDGRSGSILINGVVVANVSGSFGIDGIDGDIVSFQYTNS